MELFELLSYAKQNNASDIHLSANHPPMFRIYGDMTYLKVPALSSDEIKAMLHSVMTDKQRVDYEENLEIDFAIFLKDRGRFRVNAFNTLGGCAAVFRNVPTTISTLEQLQVPRSVESLTSLHKGLILVTGPTGSGKSTTVAALIHHINQNQRKHILTIEDPVEFVHKSDKSLINQREVGASSKSFARALKSALREDPDIILVGELRDIETIQLALTAAETGHLVISTLHTSSAAQTVDRIIDVFPSEDKEMIRTMLSTSLEAVISQRLIKRADGEGRVSSFEVLIATPAIRNLIREGKIPQIYSLMQIGSKSGMKVMKDSVFELLEHKVITEDAAKATLNYIETADNQNKNGATNTGF
jgi:twitching motility protein PilT